MRVKTSSEKSVKFRVIGIESTLFINVNFPHENGLTENMLKILVISILNTSLYDVSAQL